MNPLVEMLMAKVYKDLPTREKKEIFYEQHTKLTDRIKWEGQATTVIKEKIAHYKKTGNKRKLAIYQSKLDGKRPLISKLRSTRRSYE